MIFFFDLLLILMDFFIVSCPCILMKLLCPHDFSINGSVTFDSLVFLVKIFT